HELIRRVPRDPRLLGKAVGHILARHPLGEQGAGALFRIAGTLVAGGFAGARNEDGHLAADGGSGIVTRELDQGPGARLLEHFGQLARYRAAPLGAASSREVLQQLRYTLRRLEQHHGPLASRPCLEQAAPLAPLPREQAEED